MAPKKQSRLDTLIPGVLAIATIMQAFGWTDHWQFPRLFDKVEDFVPFGSKTQQAAGRIALAVGRGERIQHADWDHCLTFGDTWTLSVLRDLSKHPLAPQHQTEDEKRAPFKTCSPTHKSWRRRAPMPDASSVTASAGPS